MDILEKLQTNRDLILLAEIGVLIHDIGKLSEEFIAAKTENGEEFPHHLILKRQSKSLPIGLQKYTRAKNRFEAALIYLDENTNPKSGKLKNLLEQEYKKDPSIMLEKVFKQIQKANPNLANLIEETKIFVSTQFDSKKELLETINKEASIADNFLPSNLVQILEQVNIQKQILDNRTALQEICLSDVIEGHHLKLKNERYVQILRAPAGCDGVDSGVDKGIVSNKAKQPSIDKTYIATAFGYEKDGKINTSDLEDIRNDYAVKLANLLQSILTEKIKAENKFDKAYEELDKKKLIK